MRLEKDQPWGSKFMQRVSADLKTWMPEAKCFSPTNLKYMRRFFKLYCPAPIGQQVADQLEKDIFSTPWGHHMLLINKFLTEPQKALFYIHQTSITFNLNV